MTIIELKSEKKRKKRVRGGSENLHISFIFKISQ